MGYETTDYSYTYKDLSSLSADSDSKVIRGEESGGQEFIPLQRLKSL